MTTTIKGLPFTHNAPTRACYCLIGDSSGFVQLGEFRLVLGELRFSFDWGVAGSDIKARARDGVSYCPLSPTQWVRDAHQEGFADGCAECAKGNGPRAALREHPACFADSETKARLEDPA